MIWSTSGEPFTYRNYATTGIVPGSNSHFCRSRHSNEPWPNPERCSEPEAYLITP